MNKGRYFSSRGKVLLTIVNCLIVLLGTSMVSCTNILLSFFQAAGRWAGRGDKEAGDQAAVDIRVDLFVPPIPVSGPQSMCLAIL